MPLEIELDEPYQIMYDDLVERMGQEEVDGDIKNLVQNALHESTVNSNNGMK